MLKHIKQLISLILCFVIVASSVSVVFADDSTSFSDDVLSQAVKSKDMKTIISYYLSVTKEYYLLHGLEDDFQYFNASNYMDMYSSSDAVITDYKSALEAYLDHGMLSGNSCGTELDPYIVLFNHPELILNLNLQMLENEPEKFIAYLFYQYSEGNSSTQLNAEDKSFTMMLFFCPTDLENAPGYCSTTNIVRSVLGTYGQKDFNLTLMLGGTNRWYSSYINGICCNEGTKYKNGIFSIDKDKLNSTVDSLCAKYGIDIQALLDYAFDITQEYITDKEITDDVINSIFNEEVMPFAGYAGSISSGEAITDFINTSKTLYPADNYGFIVNGHGGGATGGSPYEASGSAPDAVITAEAMKAAGVDTEPFSFIAYDSCLMGCTELAGVMKDCYRYLYASEEVTYACMLNYFNLFNAIKDNLSYDDIGKIAVENIFDSYYQGGLTYSVTLLTGAVFNSSKAQDVIDTLNNVSSALNSICVDESDRGVIYNAIKLSAINAFNIGSEMQRQSNRDFYDLKDFLLEFKTSLESMKNGLSTNAQTAVNELISAQGSIDIAIEAADNLTDSHFATYDNIYIYENRDGVIQKNITKDMWSKYFGNDFSGATLFVPYLSNAVSTDSEAQTRLKSIKEEYLDKYAGRGFDNYLNLIDGYSKFCLSQSEIERVQKLAKELSYGKSADDGSTEVKSYRDIAKVELIDLGQNSSTLRVYANNYDDGDEISQYSSGNAVIDMMDTVDTLRVYITRFVQAKDSDQKDMFIDVIIGQKDVTYVEQGDNGFSIDADRLRNMDILCALANDGGYEIIRKEDYLDIGEETVKKLLCANEIVNVIISEIENDSSRTPVQKYIDVIGVLQSYTLVKGQYTIEGSSDKSIGTDAYHVFDNRGQYVFTSERTGADEQEKYSSFTPESIYFGHKVINNKVSVKFVEYNGEQHMVACDSEVCAETELGYTIESKKYDTKDGIYLLNYKLSSCTNAESVNNGYIFASYDYNNGTVVFNQADDKGNYMAASIEGSYKSLDELKPCDYSLQSENEQDTQNFRESEPLSDEQNISSEITETVKAEIEEETEIIEQTAA